MTASNRAGFLRDDSTNALIVSGLKPSTLIKTDGNFSTASSTPVDVTGLTGLTVVVGSDPVLVEFTCADCANDAAGQICQLSIQMDGADIILGPGLVNPAKYANPLLRRIVTGLTPGSSHVFKVQLSRTAFSSSGNAVLTTAVLNPAILSVTP